MSKLGATRLHPLGLGDAGHNIEADFRSWQSSACLALCLALGLPASCCNRGSQSASTEEDEVTVSHPSMEEVKQLGGAFTGEPERLNSYRYNAP